MIHESDISPEEREAERPLWHWVILGIAIVTVILLLDVLVIGKTDAKVHKIEKEIHQFEESQ